MRDPVAAALAVATIGAGATSALLFAGEPQIALGTGTLAAAALLTVVRHLFQKERNRHG